MRHDHALSGGPHHLALIYVGLGDKDRFPLLKKAYEEGSTLFVLIRTDPMFPGLRSDPRYTELLRRMGLEQE